MRVRHSTDESGSLSISWVARVVINLAYISCMYLDYFVPDRSKTHLTAKGSISRLYETKLLHWNNATFLVIYYSYRRRITEYNNQH